MFDWFWRGRINNTLLAGFLLLVLTPALVAIFLGYYYTTRNVTEMAVEDLKIMADTRVEFTENWFYERLRYIRYLADDEDMKSFDPARLKSILEKAQENNQNYKGLSVTDRRGIVVASTLAPAGTDLSDRTYMKEALEGKDSISDAVLSVVDNSPMVLMASPIKSGDQVVGAVVGALDINRINLEMFRGFSGRTGEVFLVNPDGTMVTESRFTSDLAARGVVKNKTSMELKVNTRDVAEALQGRSGFGRFTDYRGVEVISRYRWLPYMKMAIVAKKDLSEITDDARAATRSGVIAAALVSVVFLPLVVLASRKFSRPLEVLAEGADRIAGGQYGVVLKLDANREIEALAESFNRMSSKLKEQHDAQMEHIALLEEQKQEIAMQNEELAEANARLEVISVTDQLTGAYNRRYIMRQIDQELAISTRYGLPLSIIMIDIDHFKRINDTYGHQVGDGVLREIVQVLSGSIRTSDALGRYGGEEFTVLAPHTGLQEALLLAERLRQKVSGWPFNTARGLIEMTISLGVATYDGKAELCDSKDKQSRMSLIDRLLARSDEEMYKAKAQGRNRVSPSITETEYGENLG